MPKNYEWTKWIAVVEVSRKQVCRALEIEHDHEEPTHPDIGKKEVRAAECGLAIVVTTTMLEAYLNRFLHHHLPTVLQAAIENRVPGLAPYLQGQWGTRATYKYLPRLILQREVPEYEGHELHQEINALFEDRNAFVHGNLARWRPKQTSQTRVRRRWNAALEILVLLEETLVTNGQGRIPKRLLSKLKEEVRALRG